VFHPLDKSHIEKILDLQLSALSGRLQARGASLNLDESARGLLIEKGLDPRYGARPLRGTLERELEEPLAEALLKAQKSKKSASPASLAFQGAEKGGKICVTLVRSEPGKPETVSGGGPVRSTKRKTAAAKPASPAPTLPESGLSLEGDAENVLENV